MATRSVPLPLISAFSGSGKTDILPSAILTLPISGTLLVVKRVTLDTKCRQQQFGEGHFPSLDAVPHEARTFTCSTLMKAEHLISCVPERRKAEAVRNALEAPLSEQCPASLVLSHSHASIYPGTESTSMLRVLIPVNLSTEL